MKYNAVMSVIHMVRHGQASFGTDNYDRLSKRGIEQAHILAAHFIRLNMAFDALYCGDIDRQVRTLHEISCHYSQAGLNLPDKSNKQEFNEYDSESIMKAILPYLAAEDPTIVNDAEQIYTSRKAFQRLFERVMLRWVTGEFDHLGIESWKHVKERVASGLRKVMAECGRNKQVLLVASGGTISAAVQVALGMPDDETMRLCWQVVNTSVTRFMYNEERITLQSFNGFSHLELMGSKDYITYR